MDEGKVKSLSKLIEEWVKQTDGWFTYKELDNELDIGSSEGKAIRRVILHNLVSSGLVERDVKINGKFRLIEVNAPVIEWQDADIGNIVDLRWPFKLEEWVTIYPKNIIIVAGSFNAGKTAFCLNFIAKNQHRVEIANLLPIEYFNSEMGPEEMKLRLSKFPVSDWAFVARERSANFADVIRPNKINIIDYLEVTDNFFLIAEELNAIFNRLNRGIALIALQKKRGAIMGRGAEFSLEKPRLYLSMDSGVLKIVKGKNWAREGQNPNDRQWTFKLLQGWKFIDIEERVGQSGT